MKRPAFLTGDFWRGLGAGSGLYSLPPVMTDGMPIPADLSSGEMLRQKLINDFQRARYGVTFRTQSFPTLIEGEREHYRALATSVDMGQWDIHRVMERDTQMESAAYPVATPNLSMRVVKSGLGFFDALEYLARYEVTRPAQENKVAEDNADIAALIAALGDEHYVRFAMLHDIVFDIHGLPQPTLGGHIAVGGDYPVAVLQDLKNTRLTPAQRDAMAERALSAAHRNGSDVIKNFRTVLQQSAQGDDLVKMNGMAKLWLSLMETCWSRNDFCLNYRSDMDSYKRICKYQIKDQRLSSFCWDWGFKDRVYTLARDTNEILTDLKNLDPQARKMGQAFIKECSGIFLLQDAKFLAGRLNQTAKNMPDHAKLKQIEALAEQYTEIVYGSLRKGVSFGKYKDAFIQRALSEPLLKRPPAHLYEALALMEGAEKEVTAQSARSWSAARPPTCP